MSMIRLIKNKSTKYFNAVIASGFVVLFLLIAVLAAYNYYSLSTTTRLLSEIVDSNNKKTELIYDLRSVEQDRLLLLQRVVNESDSLVISEYVQHYDKLEEIATILKSTLASRVGIDPLDVLQLKTVSTVMSAAAPLQKNVLQLVSDGNFSEAAAKLDLAIAAQENVVQVFEDFADSQQANTQLLAQNTKTEFNQAFHWISIITVAVFLLAVITSWFVIKVINAQNNKLQLINEELEHSNSSLGDANQKAEQANQAKSHFIANISHELRTPMTSIKGSLAMLNSGMIPEIPDDAKNMINIADENSDRLIDLITDVLDFSKIEAGELELKEESFIIKQAINKTIMPFELKADHQGLNLKVHYEKNMPMEITADLQHINHILSQLLNNALKFTEEGCIELSIGVRDDDIHQLVMSVKDTGMGIEENKATNLFETFVQGDGSSTRKYGGTGLGLAICKKLVDALRGEIGVHSQYGKGSTFWFSVPIKVVVTEIPQRPAANG